MSTWLRCLLLAVGLACLGGLGDARAATVAEPDRAWMLAARDATPPAADRPWVAVLLPHVWEPATPPVRPAAVWFRIAFERPPTSAVEGAWAVYLPYLYAGGTVWVNGVAVAKIPEADAQFHARWERPFLVAVPATLLRDGTNALMVRAALSPDSQSVRFPRVSIGLQSALLPVYDRRLFWMRTMPQITVVVSLLAAGFVLFIWWRRRGEVLYGLFGLAAALWGIRTLTFVIEQVRVDQWQLWRVAYLGATGGFVVLMALFALRLSGLRRPWVERGLVVYWLAGPLCLAVLGPAAEPWVNQWWSAGLMPIGVAILGLSLWSVWRQRTAMSAVMPVGMVVAVLAGVHDYLIVWYPQAVGHYFPHWTDHRVFLLHHGANLMLLAMGGLLAARFIHALSAVEELNRTLESRVDDRERALAVNYMRLAALESERAAAEERQLIMRDLHDGLGSQLFTSLSRVERGDMTSSQIADALRACLADMRLALDALTPGDHDFRTALGDFMFRWQAQLNAAGVQSAWTVDVPEGALAVTPHAALQLLRVAQEALTNVLRHAQARAVRVSLAQTGDTLTLSVQDNGRGMAPEAASGGRGIGNMRSRARALGATLALRSDGAGTSVVLRVPLAAVVTG